MSYKVSFKSRDKKLCNMRVYLDADTANKTPRVAMIEVPKHHLSVCLQMLQ
jgi:hypothetical protein